MSHSFKLAHCTSLLSVLLAVPALSDDYIIDTDVMETNGGYTLDGKDSITVTEVGSVTTTKDREDGLAASGGNNTLSNSGAIKTHGYASSGLFARGDNNTLSNNGTIETSDFVAMGLRVRGHGNTLSNRGAIKTRYGHALRADGDNNTLSNSGLIETGGGYGALTVYASRGNTLINSGTIEFTDDTTAGLSASGGNNTLTNSGTIKSSQQREVIGLTASGGNNTLTNSGTIETSGLYALGLTARGDNNILINSGTIKTSGNGSYGLEAAYGSGNTTLINRGIIETNGRNSAGVQFHGTGTFTNETGGMVTAANSEAVADDDYPDNWIEDRAQSVTNAGTLEGRGIAVDLGRGDDTLILKSTSVILGDVKGGHGTDILSMELDGGGRIDGDVRSFETFRIEGGALAPNIVADVLSVSGRITGSFETVEIDEPGGRIATAVMFSDNTLSIATISPANLDAFVDVGLGNSYLFLDTLGSRVRGSTLVGTTAAAPADAPADPIAASSRAAATPFTTSAAWKYSPAIWGDILGGRGEREDDGAVAGNDYRLGGVALGMDGRLADRDIRLGWGFAYTDGDYDIRDDDGDGDTKNFMLGGYLGYDRGPYFADFVLAGGINRYENRRRVTVNSTRRTASSNFDGATFAARASGGRTWDYEAVTLQGRATLDYVLVSQDGYQETGAGNANLEVDDTTARAVRLAAEVGAARDYSVAQGRLTPELRLGVVREFALDNRAVDASLPFTGAAFPIQGNGADETRGLVRAALTFWDQTSLSASLVYHGEFGASTSNQALAAGLTWQF